MGVFDKSDDDEEKVQAAIILLHMFNPESTRTVRDFLFKIIKKSPILSASHRYALHDLQ